MKTIHLFKPIILRKSLGDMDGIQKKNALDLLSNNKILTVGRNGLSLIEISKEMEYPAHYFYGSEAVGIYRQSLGLPDVSIHSIDVNCILGGAQDFDTCYDFLYFLCRISCRNCRAKKLSEINAPLIIQFNEYRMLQEYIESLEDNNWNGDPHLDIYDGVDEENGEPKHFENPRKSLVDAGMSLLSMYDLVEDYYSENEDGTEVRHTTSPDTLQRIEKAIFGEDD